MESFFFKVWEILQLERVPSVLFRAFGLSNVSPTHQKLSDSTRPKVFPRRLVLVQTCTKQKVSTFGMTSQYIIQFESQSVNIED